jgi:hypothetical protein
MKNSRTLKNLLTFDFYGQTLVFAISLFGALTFFIGLLGMFTLGVWQVTSALVLTLFFGAKNRRTYLAAVAVYGFAIWAYTTTLNGVASILPAIDWQFGLVINAAFAIWYLSITFSDLKDARNSQEQPENNDENDILDESFLK